MNSSRNVTRHRIIYQTAVALLILTAAASHALGQHARQLLKRAETIRATTEEMKFMELPWVTDVFAGFQLAKDEARPVFLYMITGNPLDDC